MTITAQMITENAPVLVSYRDQFQLLKARPTTLDDATLLSLIMDDSKADWTSEQWVEAMEDAETDKPAETEDSPPSMPSDPAVSAAIHSDAITAATELGDDIIAFMDGLIDDGEKVKFGPLVLMRMLEAKYGVELDAWPFPDSMLAKDVPEKGTNNRIVRGNERADQYKVSVGKGKTQTRSFYEDMWRATPKGQQQEDIVRLKKAQLEDDSYTGDKVIADQDMNRAKQRIISGRDLLRKAMKVHHMLGEAKLCNGIEVMVVDLNERRTTKPLLVFPAVVPGKRDNRWQEYTVGSFQRLDFRTAANKGGSYEAVLATAKRDGNNTEAVEVIIKKNHDVKVNDIDAYELTSIGQINWLTNKHNQDRVMTLLDKPVDNADFIQTLLAHAYLLDDFYTKAKDRAQASTPAGKELARLIGVVNRKIA